MVEWYTHLTQNQARKHEGSSPSSGTSLCGEIGRRRGLKIPKLWVRVPPEAPRYAVGEMRRTGDGRHKLQRAQPCWELVTVGIKSNTAYYSRIV